MKSVEEQLKIITKGVETLVNEEELRKKLCLSREQNRPLIIKLGLDPSAPDIHLGHTVVLRKIRQMQDLGHQAVIIIGDFTGRIGDPTGKTKGRTALTKQQVNENAITYCEQIFKVLLKERTKVTFNSEWLAKLNFEEIIEIASTVTVARIMERDDFNTRYKQNIPIGLHEFFYPLMQAYDSIAVKADIELGGTDQTFNILMGRTLQKIKGKSPQIAMFMPILEGIDGKEKMSKSLGNYIGINEPANVMFKKVMEIPDALIVKYYELVTDEHPSYIEKIKKQLDEGINPMDLKIQLALIITGLYHNEAQTQKAYEYFQQAFVKKSTPDNIPKLVIDLEKDLLSDIIGLLVRDNLVSSNSEFKRLVKQGGISINNEKITDLDVVLVCGDVIRIGKKKFVEIVK
ncbi:tyrosine--tRNA ligase [Candidatus Galacturonibacter soehngenii]|uniref:Tyrosine--tRNA ligase n=1 Tax=Candidatus Galacturonatibacter soehngenii TaxID=2307010 RepID=A0A7V7QNB5_9FIRM|nr:tyrosine--tRNA ligase [Candidatus Galacturonibacter soehngenii]KAB1439908.1 tyrosine--tRNA ligase [Candidatus Galacturonibacter soehngenii]MBA4685853.1 tyrosine--tRNA ligase [Candidatus Galacturonibacter soehngenii]